MSEASPLVHSSRLCVKNIPKYIDEAKLRAHFSRKGDVTDVKVMRTKDGNSRCFGFVGFKSEAQAACALKYFHKSFIDTSRLLVEYAESFKTLDKAQHRPWSKHSAGSSAYEAAHKMEDSVPKASPTQPPHAASEQGTAPAADPKLAEFLELMKPASVTKTFANDESAPPAALDMLAAAGAHPPGVQPPQSSAGPSDEEGRRVDDLVMDDTVSDLEYLRSRMPAKTLSERGDTHEAAPRGLTHACNSGVEKVTAVEGTSDSNRTSGGTPPGAAMAAGFEEGPEADIVRSGRLFIRNLAFACCDADLLALCEAHGAVSDARVIRDSASGRSKGFGLATFVAPADAVTAWRALDGSIFQGRLIHVLPAHGAPGGGRQQQQAVVSEGDAGTSGSGGVVASSSYKRQQEAARRADAGNRRAWSTLYMREDTVAEAAAALLGVPKAELLDPSAADVAARLALGEMQVVAATKADLGNQGVNVASLELAASVSGSAADSAYVPRSASVLLVKNLPYATGTDEIFALFERFGQPVRIVMPATRALALVEMPDGQSAQRAFRGLAYRRLHNVPLYLEYAPAAVFDSPPARPIDSAPASNARDASMVAVALTGIAEAEADDEAGEATSIYIKNIAFGTSEDVLRRHLDRAASAAGGQLRAVKLAVAKRVDGRTVSKGYGFAEFGNAATARTVVKALQGVVLDAHKLELQLSTRKTRSKRERVGLVRSGIVASLRTLF